MSSNHLVALNSLGAPIASGRTAEVYAWDTGRVVKLLREGFPEILIDQEAQGTRAAHRAGIAAPEPGEIIKVGGRRGLILERVEGPTLIRAVSRRPLSLVRYARLLGQLHAQMHAIRAPDLDSQRGRFYWGLTHAGTLPEDLKNGLIHILKDLPDGDRLCHGDFHPENVILAARGPVILDWEPAMRGEPAGDVAITLLWFRSVSHYFRGVRGWLIGRTMRRMEKAYLESYREIAPTTLERLEDWIAVKAGIRYGEEDRMSFDWLERLIRERLAKTGY